ncbi:MAG: hypothetical protein WB297_18345 [Actinomycetota bacterium]
MVPKKGRIDPATTLGRIMFDTLAREVGAALRRAREARNLSLREAALTWYNGWRVRRPIGSMFEQ